jgi:transcription antitermination factor NusG
LRLPAGAAKDRRSNLPRIHGPPSEDGEALAKILQSEPPLAQISHTESTKQWFAVYTASRHEKRVAQHFERRAIDHYLPLYCSARKWKDGSKVTLNLPLFPGYVFVHICRTERVPVLEVPGVLWVVGSSVSHPTPLPEFEVETLRAALDPFRVEPYPTLTAGQRVRIRSGSLAGIQGVVVRQKSGFRIVITLELIMQSIAVEVDAGNLEPIDTARCGSRSQTAAIENSRKGFALCEP